MGLRIRMLQLSAFLLCLAFSLMLFKYLLIPLVLIGFGYALFGAIVWPIVAYLVPRHLLGTGMGILTSIQNLGLAFAPLIVTYIKTKF
jgi:MFS family permease